MLLKINSLLFFYIPTSYSANCPGLSIPDNGVSECSRDDDTRSLTCTIKCDQGYTLENDNRNSLIFACNANNGQWSPMPVYTSCVKIENFDENEESSLDLSPLYPTNMISDNSNTCMVWNQKHYKTFDGVQYSFTGEDCTYLLASDCLDETFGIFIKHIAGNSQIQLSWAGQDILFETTSSGKHVATNLYKKSDLSIPGRHIAGLLLESAASHLIVNAPNEFRLTWDALSDRITIHVDSKMKGRTCGLCGKFDQKPENDLNLMVSGNPAKSSTEMALSWISPDGTCYRMPERIDAEKVCERTKICEKMNSEIFIKCHAKINPENFVKTCKIEDCESQCETIQAYVTICKTFGVKIPDDWREDVGCKTPKCSNGREFVECGASCENTCEQIGFLNIMNEQCIEETCLEGCRCPDGEYVCPLTGGCVAMEKCPCQARSRLFEPNDVLQQDCNVCTCMSGRFECTEQDCGAVCKVVGENHISTFDGKDYVLGGIHSECDYTLLEKGDALHVILHRDRNYKPNVVIYVGDDIVKISGDLEVLLNFQEQDSFPLVLEKFQVGRQAFKVNVVVDTITVEFDGASIYITESVSNSDQKTLGLCGTFTNRQDDDFETPHGIIESSQTDFISSWKTSLLCHESKQYQQSSSSLELHPCDVFPALSTQSEKRCSVINSKLFKSCHQVVDSKQWLDMCEYDFCDTQQTPCAIISDYVRECKNNGVEIKNWRESTGCAIQCPGLMEYQECGILATCANGGPQASETENIDTEACSEGCFCPEGYFMEHDGQTCVKLEQCGCEFSGKLFVTGDKRVNGCDVCKCKAGEWMCLTHENCVDGQLCTANEAWTDCKNTLEETCETSSATFPENNQTTDCQSGCSCKKGFVRNAFNDCIPRNQCPCNHNGNLFNSGDSTTINCQECICNGKSWSCSGSFCHQECKLYGEGHFKTFDGKEFAFYGECQYILAQNDEVTIIVDLELCGSSGVTCAKGVKIMKNNNLTSSLQLDQEKCAEDIYVEADLEGFTVHSPVSGLFIIDTGFGISVQWDGSSQVKLFAESGSVNSELSGLCGNSNGDDRDDFVGPMGGPSEKLANVFADRWKLYSYCPESQAINENERACSIHPERQPWAARKCSIIKSEKFASCHSIVNPYEFYENCVHDACGCDLGGDCECMCTAIKAYADECSRAGIIVKEWRSQNLCPMQCDCPSRYDACASTGQATCQTNSGRSTNNVIAKSAYANACVEGCACEEGTIFDEIHQRCIPARQCPCIHQGQVYFDGDKVKSDDEQCQTCYCNAGQVKCVGTPGCTTVKPPTTTTTQKQTTTTNPVKTTTHQEITTKPVKTTPSEFSTTSAHIETTSGSTTTFGSTTSSASVTFSEPTTTKESVTTEVFTDCIPGWTVWTNNSPTKLGDFEKINNPCGINKPAEIDCAYKSPKAGVLDFLKSGQKTTCDLESGFSCLNQEQADGKCKNYQIRYYCFCGMLTTDVVSTTTSGNVVVTKTVDLTTKVVTTEKVVTTKGVGTTENPDTIGSTTTGSSTTAGSSPTSDDFITVTDIATGKPLETTTTNENSTDNTTKFVKTTTDGFSITSGSAGSTTIVTTSTLATTSPIFTTKLVSTTKSELTTQPQLTDKPGLTTKPALTTEPVFTTKPLSTTVPLETTSLSNPTTSFPPGTCQNGWTDWINSKPTNSGDFQRLDDLQALEFVSCATPSRIQCRVASTGEDFSHTNQTMVSENVRGCLCFNDKNDEECLDYETRFYCDCLSDVTKTCPIGMENHKLLDASLTVSSGTSEISEIGLNSMSSWTPKSNNKEQFVIIEVPVNAETGERTTIVGISTQGDYASENRVTHFKLQYSQNGKKFKSIRCPDTGDKVFDGNLENSMDAVENYFDGIDATFIKVKPCKWKGGISMRMELLTDDCEKGETTTSFILTTTNGETTENLRTTTEPVVTTTGSVQTTANGETTSSGVETTSNNGETTSKNVETTENGVETTSKPGVTTTKPSVTTTKQVQTTLKPCDTTQKWDECAYLVNTCSDYCSVNRAENCETICEPGCISQSETSTDNRNTLNQKPRCTKNKVLNSFNECVNKLECSCHLEGTDINLPPGGSIDFQNSVCTCFNNEVICETVTTSGTPIMTTSSPFDSTTKIVNTDSTSTDVVITSTSDSGTTQNTKLGCYFEETFVSIGSFVEGEVGCGKVCDGDGKIVKESSGCGNFETTTGVFQTTENGLTTSKNVETTSNNVESTTIGFETTSTNVETTENHSTTEQVTKQVVITGSSTVVSTTKEITTGAETTENSETTKKTGTSTGSFESTTSKPVVTTIKPIVTTNSDGKTTSVSTTTTTVEKSSAKPGSSTTKSDTTEPRTTDSSNSTTDSSITTGVVTNENTSTSTSLFSTNTVTDKETTNPGSLGTTEPVQTTRGSSTIMITTTKIVETTENVEMTSGKVESTSNNSETTSSENDETTKNVVETTSQPGVTSSNESGSTTTKQTTEKPVSTTGKVVTTSTKVLETTTSLVSTSASTTTSDGQSTTGSDGTSTASESTTKSVGTTSGQQTTTGSSTATKPVETTSNGVETTSGDSVTTLKNSEPTTYLETTTSGVQTTSNKATTTVVTTISSNTDSEGSTKTVTTDFTVSTNPSSSTTPIVIISTSNSGSTTSFSTTSDTSETTKYVKTTESTTLEGSTTVITPPEKTSVSVATTTGDSETTSNNLETTAAEVETTSDHVETTANNVETTSDNEKTALTNPETTSNPKTTKPTILCQQTYKPGSMWDNESTCQTCTCLTSGSTACAPISCQDSCDRGHKYIESSDGSCCGSCIKTTCTPMIGGEYQIGELVYGAFGCGGVCTDDGSVKYDGSKCANKPQNTGAPTTKPIVTTKNVGTTENDGTTENVETTENFETTGNVETTSSNVETTSISAEIPDFVETTSGNTETTSNNFETTTSNIITTNNVEASSNPVETTTKRTETTTTSTIQTTTLPVANACYFNGVKYSINEPLHGSSSCGTVCSETGKFVTKTKNCNLIENECNHWSEFDLSHPVSGDQESVDLVKNVYSSYCKNGTISKIKCKPDFGYDICDLENGLMCIGEECVNYSIELFCDCDAGTTTKSPTTESSTFSTIVSTLSSLFTGETTKPTGTTRPGLTTKPITTTSSQLVTTSTPKTNILCVFDNVQFEPGQYIYGSKQCGTYCGTVGDFVTVNSGCEYESCTTEAVVTKPLFKPETVCETESAWMDIRNPCEGSELEKIDELRNYYSFCESDRIESVICKPVEGESVDFGDSSVCDFRGYECLEGDCKVDYRVKVVCDCGNTETTTKGTVSTSIGMETTEHVKTTSENVETTSINVETTSKNVQTTTSGGKTDSSNDYTTKNDETTSNDVETSTSGTSANVESTEVLETTSDHLETTFNDVDYTTSGDETSSSKDLTTENVENTSKKVETTTGGIKTTSNSAESTTGSPNTTEPGQTTTSGAFTTESQTTDSSKTTTARQSSSTDDSYIATTSSQITQSTNQETTKSVSTTDSSSSTTTKTSTHSQSSTESSAKPTTVSENVTTGSSSTTTSGPAVFTTTTVITSSKPTDGSVTTTVQVTSEPMTTGFETTENVETTENDEITTGDIETSTGGVITTSGDLETTTTDGIETTSIGFESTTSGFESTSDNELSSDNFEATSKGVETTTDDGETTSRSVGTTSKNAEATTILLDSTESGKTTSIMGETTIFTSTENSETTAAPEMSTTDASTTGEQSMDSNTTVSIKTDSSDSTISKTTTSPMSTTKSSSEAATTTTLSSTSTTSNTFCIFEGIEIAADTVLVGDKTCGTYCDNEGDIVSVSSKNCQVITTGSSTTTGEGGATSTQSTSSDDNDSTMAGVTTSPDGSTEDDETTDSTETTTGGVTTGEVSTEGNSSSDSSTQNSTENSTKISTGLISTTEPSNTSTKSSSQDTNSTNKTSPTTKVVTTIKTPTTTSTSTILSSTSTGVVISTTTHIIDTTMPTETATEGLTTNAASTTNSEINSTPILTTTGLSSTLENVNTSTSGESTSSGVVTTENNGNETTDTSSTVNTSTENTPTENTTTKNTSTEITSTTSSSSTSTTIPTDISTALSNITCLWDSVSYQPGTAFSAGQCRSCECTATGEILCYNHADCLVSCMIFHDAHYTFDRHWHTTQICHDKIAVDTLNNDFEIYLKSDCPENAESSRDCLRTLDVTVLGTHIVLDTDFYLLEFDEQMYKIKNLPKINNEGSGVDVRFSEGRVKILAQGLAITFDDCGELYVQIGEKYFDNTCGLCGNGDGDSTDDWLSEINGGFSDYSLLDDDEECNIPDELVCGTEEDLKLAKSYCDELHSSVFSDCSRVVSVEMFYDQCLAKTCDCIKKTKSEESQNFESTDQCRCNVMSEYVSWCRRESNDCLLSTWRYPAQCLPNQCENGKIYRECQNNCARTCENQFNYDSVDACGSSFSDGSAAGCFCPDGYLEQADGTCIEPKECDNCICQSWGGGEAGFKTENFRTFDQHYYDFSSNCSQLISKNLGKAVYQVYVSVEGSLVLVYGDSEVRFDFENETFGFEGREKLGSLKVSFDQNFVGVLPLNKNGIEITDTFNKIRAEIPKIGLWLEIDEFSYGFTLRVPVSKFNNETTGLCGNCNLDKTDDETLNPSDFMLGENCFEDCEDCDSIPDCELFSNFQEKTKACDALTSIDSVFTQCHPVVDPIDFYKSCVKNECDDNSNGTICESMNSYAETCKRSGVCLNWRVEIDACGVENEEGKLFTECVDPCVKRSCHEEVPAKCENRNKVEEKRSKRDTDELTTNSTPDACLVSDFVICPVTQSWEIVSEKCIPTETCPESYCEFEDKMYKSGDTFEIEECEVCTCQKTGKITCEAELVSEKCDGNDVFHVLTQSEVCSNKFTCECDCPEIIYNCPFGEELAISKVSGSVCECDIFSCEPVENTCVHETATSTQLLEVGDSVTLEDTCSTCTCEESGLVKCLPTICETSNCTIGFEPKLDSCGCQIENICEQEYCIVELNSEKFEISPNASKQIDSCQTCTCSENFCAVCEKLPCPILPQNCVKSETPDGECCEVCLEESSSCSAVKIRTVFQIEECDIVDNSGFDVGYCAGNCESHSFWNPEKSEMQSTCGCCKSKSSRLESVRVKCGKVVKTLEIESALECHCNCNDGTCDVLSFEDLFF